MTEPEVKAEQTAPAPEAQSTPAETKETSPEPTYLTKEDAAALIEAAKADLDKQLDAAYKTLRRGEAKSDTAQKRLDKLEVEVFESSLKGLEPDKQEVERLKRQYQRDTETRTVDPQAELTSFQSWAQSYLDDEGIDAKDPTLVERFNKLAEGWTSQSDLRVALARATGQTHAAKAKVVAAESAEREKMAREDERTKSRNETRQAEGKVDRGSAPAAASPTKKNFLEYTSEEWDAFKTTRQRK